MTYLNISVFEKAISNASEKTTLILESSDPKFFLSIKHGKKKFNLGCENFIEMQAIPATEILNVIEGPIKPLEFDIEGTECRVLKDLIESGNTDRVGKGGIECDVDHILRLEEKRKKVLTLARAEVFFQDLGFGWP